MITLIIYLEGINKVTSYYWISASNVWILQYTYVYVFYILNYTNLASIMKILQYFLLINHISLVDLFKINELLHS